MSQENVEIVRRGWEHFLATAEPLEEIYAPDFVWDMGTFGLQARMEMYADAAEAFEAVGLAE